MAPDISYQDGVLEILEKNKKIDFLIVGNQLEGEYSFFEFILKIKKINVLSEFIIILENQNEELKNKLIEKGFFQIFYEDEITISEIINLIENKKINKEKIIEEEIINLKKMILENNLKKEKEKQNKIIEKIKINLNKKINSKTNKKNNLIIKNKMITIIGTPCSGKSVFSILLADQFKIKNKILLLDFNIEQNDISTILGKKKYSKNVMKKIKENKIEQINLKDFIIKINAKIDLISGLDIFLTEKKEKNKIKNMLIELKNKYEIIIIDTPSEYKKEEIKILLKNSEEIIFLLEPDLIHIKKAKIILDFYENIWKIKKEKIKLIYNKNNKNAISLFILKKIFKENYLGKINYDEKIYCVINKNKINHINKTTKKEIQKVIQKLIQIKKKKIKLKERGILNGEQFVRK